MPYQIGWQKENRIVKLMVHDDVTLTEMQKLNRALLQHLEKARDTAVHVMIDATLVNRFPNSALQVRTILTCLDHAALGCIVFVDQTTQGNMMLHILSHVLGEGYRVFGTHKAALDFLKSQDPSLNWFNAFQSKLPWRANAPSSETVLPHA
jgi:hypothetical protein